MLMPGKITDPTWSLCGFMWAGIIPESSLQTTDVDVLASLQVLSSQSQKERHKLHAI